jgi:hypothetical protein
VDLTEAKASAEHLQTYLLVEYCSFSRPKHARFLLIFCSLLPGQLLLTLAYELFGQYIAWRLEVATTQTKSTEVDFKKRG